MIPRIIHYCWFGNNPLPEETIKYIDSWKKICPNYEIKEWNENNFDIYKYKYVQEAYDNKKYAFVSDVARLYALYNEGGIYMDTDVEVIKSFDNLIKYNGIIGFESDIELGTGLIASCKFNPLIKEWLNEYANINFIKEDGEFDFTTNVTRITKSCLNYGFIPNGKFQSIKNFTFFPKDYFSPKDYKTGKINCTERTITIHHYACSWMKDRVNLINKFTKLFGFKIGSLIGRTIYFLRTNGLRKTIKRIFNKNN